jgi:hypothetical protein
MRSIVTAIPAAPLALTGAAAAPGYWFHRHWTGRREVTGSRRPRWPTARRDRTS